MRTGMINAFTKRNFNFSGIVDNLLSVVSVWLALFLMLVICSWILVVLTFSPSIIPFLSRRYCFHL